MLLSHKPHLGVGAYQEEGWAWPGPRAGVAAAPARCAQQPRRPQGCRRECSQVLLTGRTAHVAQSHVSIAVVPKHKPEQRDCRVSRKHWARWDIPSALQEKGLGLQGDFENGSFSGVFAPIIHRTNSNLKIVLFSALSSF